MNNLKKTIMCGFLAIVSLMILITDEKSTAALVTCALSMILMAFFALTKIGDDD